MTFSSITIVFSKFDLELNFDYLQIYNIPYAVGEPLFKYTGKIISQQKSNVLNYAGFEIPQPVEVPFLSKYHQSNKS